MTRSPSLYLSLYIYYLVHFPALLLNFLSSVLREEGGFEFKKAIVDAMVELMTKIPDCKVRISYRYTSRESC